MKEDAFLALLLCAWVVVISARLSGGWYIGNIFAVAIAGMLLARVLDD